MKKVMKSFLSTIAMSSLLMVGGVGSVQAFDLSFDGFCDGLNLNVGQDLTVYGSYTGCRASATSGNANYAVQPSVGTAITVVPNTTDEVPTGWVYVVYLNQNWCLYMDGTQWGCGTWSAGVPTTAAFGGKATGE